MGVEIKPRGTHLSRKEFMERLHTEYSAEAKYAWAAGQAFSRFLEELKNGRIIGRRCNKCGRITVPPRMYCEHCFRPTDEWVYVRPVGRVFTAVVSYIASTRERLKEPEVVGIIRFEDAPEGGLFHRIKVDPELVINRKVFGMKVRAVFKPKEERVGSINDILYFEPVEEGGEE